MKKIACLLIVLWVSSMAHATPYLRATETQLDGGLLAWSIYLPDDGSGPELTTVSLYFGTIVGGPVVQQGSALSNSESQAALWGVLANDTYAASPFGENPTPGGSLHFGDSFYGFRQGNDWWEMSCSAIVSGGAKVAQVVDDGDWVGWYGTITRGSQTLVVSESLGVDHVEAGGPYVINPGDSLKLRPMVGGTFRGFWWDFDFSIPGRAMDYETVGYGDPHSISYTYLESLGLSPGHTYDISFLADERIFGKLTASTTLTITPEPATLTLLAAGAMALRRRRALRD